MRVTRRLEIDAGHRLMDHEGTCASAHGHRYAFEIACEAPELDEIGRVVDFGVIKERVGGWLDERLDHAFIAQEGDPVGRALEELDQRVYWLSAPPTAEHLARHVFEKAAELLPKEGGLEVVAVTCHETPNSSARYEPGRPRS